MVVKYFLLRMINALLNTFQWELTVIAQPSAGTNQKNMGQKYAIEPSL